MKNKVVFLSILMVMIVAIITAGGCIDQKTGSTSAQKNQTATTFDPSQKIVTGTFASVDEYQAFVKQYQNGGYYREYPYGRAVTITGNGFSADGRTVLSPTTGLVSTTVPAPMGAKGDSGNADFYASGTPDYSGTNVQVQGVDEADMLKTDGAYIYTITEDTVFIIKAYPGKNAAVVSTIKFDNERPVNLFVNGNYLAVFGDVLNISAFKKMNVQPQDGMTFFNIYDISDRADPILAKEYRFEGSYFNARMIDQWVYFVVSNNLFYRPDYPTPIIMEGTAIRSIPVNDIYRFDIPYRSPQLVTVHSIDITHPSGAVESKSITVEGGQNLYMSAHNIFITATEYIDEYQIRNDILKDVLKSQLTAAENALIAKITATDNEVLSPYEKETKITQVYQTHLSYLPQNEANTIQNQVDDQLYLKLEEMKYNEFTVINKVGVSGGEIKVLDNGKVPGHIMNQFSLDEDSASGVLRIATTVSARWSRFGGMQQESINNIYTLDSGMNALGKLEGLAQNEQIYSTRFMGNKLYMVTFRQMDPFFVIDLSNPSDIRELGQLKIPGFSRYLHPYDENTIIGIGQDTTSSGRTTGLKISLFDVSDFAHPIEIAKYVSDQRYMESTAMYEHKAFLFSKEKELLVIPVYGYGWTDWWGRTRDSYNGALVFQITRDKIEIRDLIDHSDGLQNESYAPQVERSLYISDLLYTKSPHLLKINALDDLSLVKDVELK